MQHEPRNRLPRAAVHVVLPLLLGVIALTLTQCRMVGDNLTGVDLLRRGPTTCIKQCNDHFKILFDQEQKLHKTNVEFCQTLPQPEKGECLEAESDRHGAEMDRLGEDKVRCQQDCRHQGGGGTR